MKNINKKIICFFLILIIVFFTSCSSTDYTPNKNDYSDKSGNTNSNNGNIIEGEIVDTENETTESTTEEQITPITGDYFSDSIQTSTQRIERTYTATETGIYRFDFNLSSVNDSIYFSLMDKSQKVEEKIINDGTGMTIRLIKDETYYLTFQAKNGLPELTMTIGVPHPIIVLEETTYTDEITYVDQNNRYQYTAPRSGIYRFDVIPDYVTVDSIIVITAPDKSEIVNRRLEGKSGVTVNLTANTCYDISIIQKKGVSKYSINIGVPDDIFIIDDARIEKKLDYKDDVDIYILSVPTAGKYRFTFDISNVNANYSVEIYDEKRNTVFSRSYLTQGTYDIYLNDSIEYELQVIQKNGLPTYQIEYSLLTD